MAAAGDEPAASDGTEASESSNGIEPPAIPTANEREGALEAEAAPAATAVSAAADDMEKAKSEIPQGQLSSLGAGTEPNPAGVGNRTFTMRELLDKLKEKGQAEERSGAGGA